MGCSSSKPERAEGSASSIPGSRHEDEDEAVPETGGSSKKQPAHRLFHSHTTEASSNLGFRGSGPSVQSFPSTTESFPRSEGGSDMGSMSLFSASSKRSTGGFGIGEKLSELSDEEGFEEDFEDADEGPRRARGARAGDRPAPLRTASAAAAPVSRCVPSSAGCLFVWVLYSSRTHTHVDVADLTTLPFCAEHVVGTVCDTDCCVHNPHGLRRCRHVLRGPPLYIDITDSVVVSKHARRCTVGWFVVHDTGLQNRQQKGEWERPIVAHVRTRFRSFVLADCVRYPPKKLEPLLCTGVFHTVGPHEQ